MNIGVLIFPDVEELDFVGPWEMFSMWSKHAEGQAHRHIVAQTTLPITCAKGLVVTPGVSFTQCPALDVLLVPGGEGTRREVNNKALINFIKQQATHCTHILSVCTGSFLLHRAGLLSGKRATTHWNSLDRLRGLGDVEVVEDRFIADGNIWTSAGVSAGMDMSLAFIAEHAGVEAASKTQAAAEYYPISTNYGNFHQHPKAPQYIRNELESA